MTSIKHDIQAFWNDNPQTYGDTHGITVYDGVAQIKGTREFFRRLDAEFFKWNHPLHNEKPFDRLFPYSQFNANHRVLEIGCGMGTMAMLWAQHGVQVTAIDLNSEAVQQTRRRFELFGLKGTIEEGDATALQFENDYFDYVYSWGVLHHSPNSDISVREMIRVLKPGGMFGLMMYHRRSLLHWYWTHYIEGFLHYEHRFLGTLELTSRYGDGYAQEGNPHTWPITKKELRAMLLPWCRRLHFHVLGTELDSIFKLLLPGIGMILPRSVKKCWARRFGWSLWAWGEKK